MKGKKADGGPEGHSPPSISRLIHYFSLEWWVCPAYEHLCPASEQSEPHQAGGEAS